LIGLWPSGSPGPSPFEATAANEAERRFEAALAALPAAYCEALLLVVVEGLRPTEAAVVCGVTAEAMRQRLSRGRALLAPLFANADALCLAPLNEVIT
jgi:DNA-directed RNA polymerase specialized sigma24 family protein